MYSPVPRAYDLDMETNMNIRARQALESMADTKTMATVSQLLFEGAYWWDEGTHVALMVQRKDSENEDAVLLISFNTEGELGTDDFEECFDLESYIRDGD